MASQKGDDCQAHMAYMTRSIATHTMDHYIQNPDKIDVLKTVVKEMLQLQVVNGTKTVVDQDIWMSLFDAASKSSMATRGQAMQIVRDGYGVAGSLCTNTLPIKIGSSCIFTPPPPLCD